MLAAHAVGCCSAAAEVSVHVVPAAMHGGTMHAGASSCMPRMHVAGDAHPDHMATCAIDGLCAAIAPAAHSA